MRYTATIYKNSDNPVMLPIRVDTTVRIDAIQLAENEFVDIIDNITREEFTFHTQDELDAFKDAAARGATWARGNQVKHSKVFPTDRGEKIEGVISAAKIADGTIRADQDHVYNFLEETDGFHVASSDMTLGELKFDHIAEKSLAAHVDPAHYQGYVCTEKECLQWLETMQYLPRFRNPETFCGAVEIQIRKYLDRNGGKDGELQEFSKALWYMKFITAYMKNGYKPIRVKDIDSILKSN